MTCAYCGSALPPGALFCGECGRSSATAVTVTAPAPVPAPESASSTGADSSWSLLEAGAETPEELDEPQEPDEPEELQEPEEPEAFEEPDEPEPSEEPEAESSVAVSEPPLPRFLGESGPGLFSAPLPAEPAPPGDDGIPTEQSAPSPTEPMNLADLADSESAAIEPEHADDATPAWMPPAPLVEPLLPVPVIQYRPPVPTPEPGENEPGLLPPRGAEVIDPLPIDLERTRFVQAGSGAERYVLQFSTGESVTIRGNGLIGRNPFPQPGEFVDQLVTLFDAGKSVSKTHLEFGQDGGRFWISDRFSTNGSIVRLPDTEPRRCEPGKRYLVSRGTRIDIGEQFFIIS